MSNKKSGNDFEQRFAEILARNGYWVHRMTQNAAGQPFDIIAVRRGVARAIDCKVCETDRFNLSRIEENQESAMDSWLESENDGAYFVLEFSDGVIAVIDYYNLIIQRDFEGKSSLSKRQCLVLAKLILRPGISYENIRI